MAALKTRNTLREKKIQWKFSKFSIEKREYGDLKGKYIGKVHFEKDNGIDDSILLSMSEKDTKEIFEILKKKMPQIFKNILQSL